MLLLGINRCFETEAESGHVEHKQCRVTSTDDSIQMVKSTAICEGEFTAVHFITNIANSR